MHSLFAAWGCAITTLFQLGFYRMRSTLSSALASRLDLPETAFKNRLAIIVFGSRFLRNCSEFYSRNFLVLDQQAGPAAVVLPGRTALQKWARLLEHGCFLVIAQDDTLAILSLPNRYSRTLKNAGLGFPDQALCHWIAARFQWRRRASA